MESLDLLRRVAAEATTATTTSLQHATTTEAAATPSNTIGMYATDLNGVNQSVNNLLRDVLWWCLGSMALIILVFRMMHRAKSHLRHMTGMNSNANQQRYFQENRSSWWKVKKHLLYAPLWNKRHNREFKLSSAVNMGTLPSRWHALLLIVYLSMNVAYTLVLDYSRENKYSIVAELRGRSGVLAVCNMIALIILAGRNNPLIGWLQISFDTYNLLHRWMGRIVVLEALVHTSCWAYVQHADTGFSGVWDKLMHDPFCSYGMMGTASFVLILLTSPSPIRHAFYETFLNLHIIFAAVAIAGVWIHCDIPSLPQKPYIRAVAFLWVADRVFRMARLIWCNYSTKGWTTASIEAMPGDACRVTMHLPKKLDVKPGSHAYLRFAKLNFWESHPFSIAWVAHRPKFSPELPLNEKRMVSEEQTTDISFVIHAQTGLTRRLFDAAKVASPRVLRLKAAFEGPYAGHHSLDSYGHAVLFAGSSGITHQIPYVQHLIQGYNDGTIATKKVLLVWIIRDIEHLEWVRPWMDEILRMQGRRDILTIKLFVTKPKNPKEIHSPSATVQMLPGRPNINLLLQTEVREQVGAMCVTVCGPGALQDSIREAVREVQEHGVVDFIEESFTW
ncbi:putative ferric reductase protein [Botrytis fragariae]|uniref:ferric-chelate reductase (NADPH) n=1 Tax=Botrytis fragariae TaxID=1964551 RepID=A0A8H6ATD5_9HELO|nr:putative ferric reductase protein [Botrytis fragariae]KAF5873267.1 putative ferric reductase protein [Botrytis fragariae]